MNTNISLADSIIIADDDQASYVKYGIQEVADYLREITAGDIPIKPAPDAKAKMQIVIGEKSVRQLAPEFWAGKVKDLGAEGFLIRVVPKGKQTLLLVAGATPQGTKYGLIDLMKRIRVEGRSAFVPADMDIVSKPSFSMRGIHLNGWAFDYPYTFRCWKEEDWKRYADILAYQGANLFFIWPFMEIMPAPLSAEDEAYLQEVRRVVDYAQRQRGLEVWIFQSPNRVGVSDCGVRDPRLRPYWVTKAQGDYAAPGQADMNPADPKQFEAIMKSREALYRIVNNADGYSTIDNDPGGWSKSPISDFMKIFRASRKLLDATHERGKQAKLIYWLWYGWGQPGGWTPDQRDQKMHEWMRETIRAMKQEVPEPWRLIAGMKRYVSACADEGCSAKTVYLPYNTIEGEPSRPGTQHDFPLILEHVEEIGRYPETAGLMGNTQTPLLQFPHVHYFLSTAWDYEYRKRAPREVMLDAAEQVYPEHKQLLADCWMAMTLAGRGRIDELTHELEQLVNGDRLGRPGILGRKLFPDSRQIARDLVLQLKAWAAFEKLRQTAEQPATTEDCAQGVEAFLDAALTWDRMPGWSAYWRKLGSAWDLWPAHDPGFPKIVAGLKRALGGAAITESALDAFLTPIGERLAKKHDSWIVANCAIATLKIALLKVK